MAVMISTVPAVSQPVRAEVRLSDAWLHVVVVRLLALSLMVMRRRFRRAGSQGRGLPKGYRAWPALEFDADSSTASQYRKFYVCPKGAGTADDEAFPVGTVLVIETYAGRLDRVPVHRGATSPHRGLHSVFVLEKFASLQRCCDGQGEQGAWTYATYDAEGRMVPDASASCGVGRVGVRAREMCGLGARRAIKRAGLIGVGLR